MNIKQEKAKTLSTLLAGLGVGLFPTLSFGLGLGDIQIESQLNQRLHARIEVVDVSDEEWQQIRARIAPRTLASEATVHPEMLESLHLRAIEDANHRHFIEVTSADVLTEPLFDLPVAVAGRSLQVVRNYSVLLDPASTEDVPQSVPASMLAQQAAPQAHFDAPKRVTRQHRSRSVRRHSSSSHRVAAATNKTDVAAKGAAAVQPAAVQAAATQDTAVAKAAEQQHLEGQLATLQQMLTKMQATIAAQDAEIAKLTAQVAAHTESQVSRNLPAPQVETVSSNETEVSDEGARAAPARGFSRTHPLVYRLAGIVGGMVVLVLGAVAFIRRRHSSSLREIHTRESARKDAPPGAEPKSDVLAWQSSLREAQSGTWRSPMKSLGDAAAIQVDETHADSDGSSGPSTPPVEATDPEATVVATAVGMNEPTANLEADLEALSASYESEHVHTMTGVIDEWRAQKELLERDYLSDTEALPFVLDEGNRAKSSETVEQPPFPTKVDGDEPTEEQPIPVKRGSGEDTVADISSARSAKNREVAAILEQSLDFEPHRVDIQLKLLEIYHQEALGSRDNFDALLNKLAAAQQHLSSAQLLHLEMLQRSLREGKPNTDSDFVADVAI